MYDRTHYDMVQPEILDSLDRYAKEGIPTGGFLLAVLSNDLFEAVGRADHNNLPVLHDICRYVFNELPSPCWGSSAAIKVHLERLETTQEAKRQKELYGPEK